MVKRPEGRGHPWRAYGVASCQRSKKEDVSVAQNGMGDEKVGWLVGQGGRRDHGPWDSPRHLKAQASSCFSSLCISTFSSWISGCTS
jgi:hypothetical protein